MLHVYPWRWFGILFLGLLLGSFWLERPATAQNGDGQTVYLPYVVRSITPTATPSAWSAFEIQVVELVNEARADNGCTVMLTMNDQLHLAAYNHSLDMIARDFFSHVNPDGKDPGDRLDDVGYDWWTYGENIAAGYSSPESVMAGWMNSSGHRANILNCNFTEIGVGYAYAADDPGTYQYHHYWTQVFARPR